MQAIGIDIGTTSICGVVIDTESGKLLKSVTKNSNAFIPTENAWEKIQSVEKIISIADSILEECISDETAVIGVTGQMHGIVYTDAEGKAVSPLYTWQDGRGNQPYKGTTYADYLNSHSGYGNVTDFYNKENGLRPESAVNFCTIHDYLVMHLCGLKKALVHTSDAASFGCFDIKNNTFSYDNGVDVVADYRIAGYHNGVPVSVAIGDNQASVLSSLSGEDDILLNVGTGSQISLVADHIVEADNIETRPYFEGKYLIAGSALCGGRAYAVLKEFYRNLLSYLGPIEEGAVYGIMDKMLEADTDCTLSVDTRFSGTRADESIRGSITNISTENFTPAQLSKGVLQGMTDELFGMYSDMGIKKSGVVGSGNGIRRNKALADIAAKKFGSKVKIPSHTEEASFGAAMFGMVAAGICKNAAEAQKFIQYISE
ncbi:MAG: hypothetical protein IIW23_03105 [Clostridia bacterium]|nr:hypothetical protein [Clostridia bacterium]